MRGTRKDWDGASREEVLAIVEKFLEGGVRKDPKNRGGFAEVAEGDKDELDEIIRALVKFRYEPDPDGDRPIRWSLCDWTREEPSPYVMLPRLTKQNTKRYLQLAETNVSIAAGVLRSAVRNIVDEE